jgi:hypothetical protein
MAERAEPVLAALASVPREIEASGFAPADTMPIVIGVNEELASFGLLIRWLRSYDAIASRRDISFAAFVTEMQSATGDARTTPEARADIVDAYGYGLSVLRGEVAVGIAADFSWVAAWVEQHRSRKSLGLFGTEEQVAQTTQLLVPVWIVDVLFARATGTVFKAGAESRGVALVEACDPRPEKTVFFADPAQPIVSALSTAGVVGATPLAIPRSSRATAQLVVQQALRSRPDVMSPRVQVRGLGFVSAAAVRYQSPKGTRDAIWAAAGSIPVDWSAVAQVELGQQLMQRFG